MVTPTQRAMPTPFYAQLGKQLRRARDLKGWSLPDVVQASGGQLKPAAILSYERGHRRVNLETLYALATLYEVPLSMLLPPEPLADPMVPVRDVLRVLRGHLTKLMDVDPADYELKA